jgi:antitoxin component YwqK of YwqJK toxin-antitoxin module
MRTLVTVAVLLVLGPWFYARLQPRQFTLAYWPDGRLRYRVPIVTDAGCEQLRQGRFQSFYQNGAPESVGAYRRGKRSGLWRWFDPEGRITGECRYDEGLGDFVSFDPEGRPVWSGQLEDTDRVGKWLLRDAAGRIVAECRYEHGYGRFVSRYENGRVWEEGYLQGAERVGHWRTFYPDGRPRSEGEFRNNEMHGVWFYWTDDVPQVRTEAEFRRGVRIR